MKSTSTYVSLIRGFLFTFFTLKRLLSAYYYCKAFLPTIGGLDPRVPPGSVLLSSTVKLAPLNSEVMQILSRNYDDYEIL